MRRLVRLGALGMVLTVAASTAALAAQSASSKLPSALQGIWFVPEESINKSCARYLALPAQADGDEQIGMLASSIVIAPMMIHAVAEYGEGNFYTVHRVAKSGKNQWMVSAGLTIDTPVADENETKKTSLTLKLAGNRLSISESGGKDGPYVTSGLVRCTPKLPKGY